MRRRPRAPAWNSVAAASSGYIGVRSAPPPNQALLVTMWRVFICAAGTSGEHIWATSEMPLAQKRGSCDAPGISLRNSGENSPDTVEMLTPTFSKTCPRMTEIVPPPPPGRCHSLRSKRPGGRPSGHAPANSASIASNSAQIRSRSSENHASAGAHRTASGEKEGCSVMGQETIRFDAIPRRAQSRPRARR